VRRLVTALPRAWHLLSLDAPTVAGTWCAAFLLATGASRRSQGLRCPVLFLSVATWLCYVGDRVLDARSALASESLRARHHFYGALWRARRAALLAVVSLAALGCSVIALTGLSSSLLGGFAALTGVSVLYFASVHVGAATRATQLPKEAAVAAIFAVGCVLPAWTEARPALRPCLASTGALFAVLCWLNCVAIERWEGGGSVCAGAHPSTRWAARHLARLLVAGGILAGALRFLQPVRRPGLDMLSPCLAAAFSLLAVLEGLRPRLSRTALRILADMVLLTPLSWWVAGSIAR
jgi:hypothetical protein